jgi:hypothetical protein
MIAWIESQQTEVIALVTFGLTYVIVGLIGMAAAFVSTRRISVEVKSVTPVILTPLSVVFGLLIAFLANRVWTNFDHAASYAAQEASSIRQAVLLTDAFPADTRHALRDSLRAYLDFVESKDWPAMADGRANIRQPPPGLSDALHAALTFDAATRSQAIAQERIIVAIENALEIRRNRVLLSQGSISALQWAAITALAALMLCVLAMVHMDRPRAGWAAMLVLSTAVATCLVLLFVHDKPYGAGGFTVAPAALHDIRFSG